MATRRANKFIGDETDGRAVSLEKLEQARRQRAAEAEQERKAATKVRRSNKFIGDETDGRAVSLERLEQARRQSEAEDREQKAAEQAAAETSPV